jgi:hypothetical protein
MEFARQGALDALISKKIVSGVKFETETILLYIA